MTVNGGKNAHYICDLKMEAQIACAHNVVLRAPGLTIDKAGVVSPTLVYDFAAGAGLVAQGLGWQGSTPGRYPVDCDITSPYFVTPSGLKIKKDTFDIIIQEEEPDGWSGTDHGVLYFSNNSGHWTPGSLYYKLTVPPGGITFRITLTPEASGRRSIGISAVGPTTVVAGGYSTTDLAQVTLGTAGVYKIYPYTDVDFGETSASSYTLGTISFAASLQSPVVPLGSKSCTRRGRIHKRQTPLTIGVGSSKPFSGVGFGATLAEYMLPLPSGPLTYVRLPNGTGGNTSACTSSGVPPTASGYFPGLLSTESGNILWPTPNSTYQGACYLQQSGPA